ncbi:MAG TPA: phosphate regulon sensor histidine kinase PhoR [Casimicrobiaceae bacterium]|nr:phosphate regulon sensor histidine kinase PhoR [Casimicrobiaceae bacterium]
MKPIVRQGLIAPATVAAVALFAWSIAGSGVALLLIALGASAIIGFHLWQLQRIADWAAASLDAEVPEGRGEWRPLFAAIYRRMRVRVAYERDLRHVIERFRQAAAAIPDGIVVLDAGNRIDWANPRACAQFGFDLAQDRGQPIVNLVRQPEFHRYLEAGDYAASIIVASIRDAGRTLSLQLVPFAAEQKLLMSRDVTELEAVSRMRRDFIANVSHELKTPLTVINGFIETLQDVEVDDRQRARFLQLMQTQASNMQRLVADLLTLSALENEQNVVHEERFDIAPLLLALSSDAKSLSGDEHRIGLDIRESAIVHGSRDELASAFGNLVSNAVRYTPPGGAITLGWRVDPDGSGVFAVTDTGIGIAAEYLPRLTERFYRVDRGRSRATGGTGLGLAIVKHVLLRHQAEIEITSERGKGSTFAVRLPAQRVERASAPDDAATATQARLTEITSSEAPRGTGS